MSTYTKPQHEEDLTVHDAFKEVLQRIDLLAEIADNHNIALSLLVDKSRKYDKDLDALVDYAEIVHDVLVLLTDPVSQLEASDDLQAATPSQPRYPYESGDTIVLGPGIFAAEDRSVLNWAGENYVPQGTPSDGYVDGYVDGVNDALDDPEVFNDSTVPSPDEVFDDVRCSNPNCACLHV